ncbi:MAG TPA: hypothetical protein VFT06_08795, partial [Flavisolibacter sp.]|nr:hypothetical protein [Flavisolibacter sp.]
MQINILLMNADLYVFFCFWRKRYKPGSLSRVNDPIDKTQSGIQAHAVIQNVLLRNELTLAYFQDVVLSDNCRSHFCQLKFKPVEVFFVFVTGNH